jgi:hypothetical protein
MDCDMLVLEDIAALWRLRDERYAVQVVKHHHVPKEEKSSSANRKRSTRKRTGRASCDELRALPRAHPRVRQHRERASAAPFQVARKRRAHRRDSLPAGTTSWATTLRRRDAALVHFTIGGPYFDEYRDCEYATEWFAERDAMLAAIQRERAAV